MKISDRWSSDCAALFRKPCEGGGRSWLVLLLVAWAVLAGGGCGGASDESRDQNAPSSQAPPKDLSSQEPSSESSGDQGATPAQAGAPRVVFLGDSISAGYGLPESQAYPALVAERLQSQGSPIRMVNAGQSGDTTTGALRRLDWVLKEPAACVVVQIGANDAFRGVPLEKIESQIAEIVSKALESGARVLLLGMRIPPSYGADYSEGFAALYDRIGARDDVAYLPFFMKKVAGRPDLNLEDGIHPNPAGHELLAGPVAEALQPLIR